MKLKIFLVSLIFIFCASFASSQTISDVQKQALIAQIQQQIILLTQQLQQMLAQGQVDSSWCYSFNNNLGASNSAIYEITNLHYALQKQGISYSPDDINTYSSGTSQAVIQFQKKYNISPQSGFTGPKTRAQLNKLYACQVITPATCKSNWNCGNWSLCNGQQTRICTDLNGCGTLTNEPATTQSCTQVPAVQLQANNSDGPLNLFLTLGNGANVANPGIALSQNINLKWTGIDVSSCMASDTLNPTVFSGYQPPSSSATVVLSGTIDPLSSGNNRKITDTFKINCVSVATGSQVSDSLVVNLFYTVSNNCSPSWQCSLWTNCANNKQTRTCIDYSGCGSLMGQPVLSQGCTTPPVVSIKANNSEGPITVAPLSDVNLSWTTSGATSCLASGDWSDSKNFSGSQSIKLTSSSEVFSLTCVNNGGATTDSVTVNTTGS